LIIYEQSFTIGGMTRGKSVQHPAGSHRTPQPDAVERAQSAVTPAHVGTLNACVALVTGATRGAGRAIALVLGEAGATVYVTGRSTAAATPTEGLPGTVEDAAEAVTARGGRGIGLRVDHTRDDQVQALLERIQAEHGRLDLLVNNVWGGYERYGEASFVAPFWEQPLWRWEAMFRTGVRAHLAASRFAAPLMLARGSGLIVSTVAWAHDAYLGNVMYDSAKAAIIRMIFGMARELRPHGVSAVALAPGFMRTERVLAAHAASPFDLSGTESPEYVGRAVAALAADPGVASRSGQLLTAGDLAREYGFTDVDGRQPPPFELPVASA
jgi:NAD(P)-dependent dehydrogenase (short-subunit alcohol dehydrogenase family)